MKKALYSSVALISLGVGVGLWLMPSGTPPPDPLTEAKPRYYCPMHPHIHADEDGSSCPICGMDLILDTSATLTDDSEKSLERSPGHEDGEEIEISQLSDSTAIQQPFPVVKTTVVEEELIRLERSFGEVASDPELYQAQIEHLEIIKGAAPGWTEMIKASQARLKALGLSKAHIASLEKKRRPEEALITSQGPDPLIVYAQVSEDNLPHIFIGQRVKVIRGWEKASYKGKVMFLDHQIDPIGRTAIVRIELEGKSPTLRAGSQVQVEFIWPAEKHVTLPFDSLMQRSDGAYIFIIQGENISPAKVEVLMIVGDKVAIGNRQYLGADIVRHSPFLWDADSRFSPAAATTHSHH